MFKASQDVSSHMGGVPTALTADCQHVQSQFGAKADFSPVKSPGSQQAQQRRGNGLEPRELFPAPSPDEELHMMRSVFRRLMKKELGEFCSRLVVRFISSHPDAAVQREGSLQAHLEDYPEDSTKLHAFLAACQRGGSAGAGRVSASSGAGSGGGGGGRDAYSVDSFAQQCDAAFTDLSELRDDVEDETLRARAAELAGDVTPWLRGVLPVHCLLVERYAEFDRLVLKG